MEFRFIPQAELVTTEKLPSWFHKNQFDLKTIEEALSDCLQSVQENYLKLGILLKKVKVDCLYSLCSFTKDDGSTCPCRSVEDYAMIRFGLSKTVVHNAISIVDFFFKDGALYPGLNGFGYSALCEFVPLAKNSGWVHDKSFLDTYGYNLPEWFPEEIKPEMTVKEIREIKKRHKKVTVKSAQDENPVDASDGLEYEEDDVAEELPNGSWHIFKNDTERKSVFDHYRSWEIFSANKYLGLTYYRLNLSGGFYAIAVEWKSSSPYYSKTNGGFRRSFHLLEKDKPFEFDVYSISSFLRIMHEKKLYCELSAWDRMFPLSESASTK